jgi:hypothetical protein
MKPVAVAAAERLTLSIQLILSLSLLSRLRVLSLAPSIFFHLAARLHQRERAAPYHYHLRHYLRKHARKIVHLELPMDLPLLW